MNDAPQQAQQPAAQPAQEMSVSSIAKGFLDDIDGNPDPNQIGEPPEERAPQDEVAQGDDEQQQESEEAAGEPEGESEQDKPQPVPMVEFEAEDGKKYQVPEAIKGNLMRDKDYRQKTQILAEQRNAYEQLTATAQQLAAQAQQMAPYHAQLFSMENLAQQLQSALTMEMRTNDPIEFNRIQGELAILLRNKDSLASDLSRFTSHLQQQQAELRSRQLAVEAPKLFEEIPDLADQDVRMNLGKYVLSQGINEAEFVHMNYSPAATKLAWKAQQYDRMVKEQANAKAKIQQSAKVSPTVGKPGASGVTSEAKQKQAFTEWKKSGGGRDSPHFKSVLRSLTKG